MNGRDGADVAEKRARFKPTRSTLPRPLPWQESLRPVCLAWQNLLGAFQRNHAPRRTERSFALEFDRVATHTQQSTQGTARATGIFLQNRLQGPLACSSLQRATDGPQPNVSARSEEHTS